MDRDPSIILDVRFEYGFTPAIGSCDLCHGSCSSRPSTRGAHFAVQVFLNQALGDWEHSQGQPLVQGYLSRQNGAEWVQAQLALA